METVLENPSIHSKRKRNLTNQERQAIFEILVVESDNGKLSGALFSEIAASFSTTERTVRRIWARGTACIYDGLRVDVSSKLQGRVGRKRIQINENEFTGLSLRERSNVRSLSSALSIAKSTVHRRIKEGLIRPHSNALKPYLSEECKKARLRFCLSMLEPNTLETQPRFKDMYNYVHIDEKWFYMSKEAERYYILPNENEPHRTCKSKRFITKVMFLAAVARPRFDAHGNEEFSGKIGIFPFTCKEPAKRSSKNRAAGTLETKAITVTKEVTKSCLIEKVLPAIRAKWPHSGAVETIYIQQDNARPHIRGLDPEFVEAATQDGFDMRLSFQPPSSPDLNVLDLGFFRAIQSLQYQKAPKTIDELVDAVEKSFEEMSSDNLNRVFLTLQSCMVEIMKVNGGNNYKLPHMGKSHLIRNGILPSQLQCDRAIVENAQAHLQQ